MPRWIKDYAPLLLIWIALIVLPVFPSPMLIVTILPITRVLVDFNVAHLNQSVGC